MELEDKLARCDRNCKTLREENQRLLADQAKADAAINKLRSQLEELELGGDTTKASEILKEALTLKANAGGEIKKQIREALKLIGDV